MRTRARPLWLAAGLALAAGLGGAPARAQTAPEPIGEVRRDADADAVPDRLGERVRVGGRLTVPPGTAYAAPGEGSLQDGTGGLFFRLAAPVPGLAAGDSVVAEGVIGHLDGRTLLDEATVRRAAAPHEPPRPLALDLATDALEPHEGRLAQIEGVVVGRSTVDAGRYLTLASGDSTVVVFAYAGVRDPVDLDAFHAGDRLRVTGVVGQYDRDAPYIHSYQLYPRSGRDLAQAALPASFYRWLAGGITGLLLLALAALAWLRRQVRLRAEALRRSEARYGVLFDQASDPVFVQEDGPDRPGRIVEANQAALAALGYGPEELRARALSDLVVEGSRDALRAHAEALKTGEARSSLRLRRADGQAVAFEVHTHRVQVGGEWAALSIARDVTQQKAYENQLVQARQQAEALARAKSAFLSQMSHEIRTPLNAVLGFAEMLADEVGDEHREFAVAIREGGHRLLETLNSVLDLARIDAGGLTLRPRPVDAAVEVRHAAGLLTPLARAKGIAVLVNTPEAAPACLDPLALGRVVTNLVANAIKFTDAGGVTVSLETTPEQLRLLVADTGVGIDAAFLPRLFDPFRQESEGLDRQHEGSGLGLAITHRLVEMMGGAVAVESEKGTGTTFTVTLPVPEEGTGDALASGTQALEPVG